MNMNVNGSTPATILETKKVAQNQPVQQPQKPEFKTPTNPVESAKPAKDSNHTTNHKSHASEPAVTSFPTVASKKTDGTNKPTQGENLNIGDAWNGGKVEAVNVKPTGYRNVSKGIEGGVFDTKFSKEHYKYLQSQERKGNVTAGSAEAYKNQHLLQNLQDFLDGKADHVSLAFDKKLYENGTLKKGQKFRIPELEKAYGKAPIIFVAQDTGSKFTDKGFSRMDICTRDEKDPKTGRLYESDPRLNDTKLTLVKM